MANNGHNGKKSGAQLGQEIDEVLRMRQKKAAASAPRAPRSTGLPSQAEYEHRELADAQKKLSEVRRAPLSERKEAQADFFEAMRDNPEIVGERIGWLLDGSYGYGSMQLAKRVLGSPRTNRSAALTQMIGAFEWLVPEDMVRAAWKKLTKSQQAALERAVKGAIDDALAAG